MKKLILFGAILSSAATFNYLNAQITSPAPYCVADFDDDPFNVDNAINSVSLGTLNNVSGGQYAAPHYVFYNNLTAPNLVKGSQQTLTVGFKVNGGCGYGVWIDYNQNNIFEPSEKISGTPVEDLLDLTANTIITETFTIPATALNGNTRMRVRIVEDDTYTFGANGYSILPCNASTSATDVMDWGETEDYTVNITGGSSVGVNEVTAANAFSIYPNPTSEILFVQSDFSANASYSIVNLAGQEVQAGSMNEKEINVSSILEGIYFLQVIENNHVLGQQKFVKN